MDKCCCLARCAEEGKERFWKKLIAEFHQFLQGSERDTISKCSPRAQGFTDPLSLSKQDSTPHITSYCDAKPSIWHLFFEVLSQDFPLLIPLNSLTLLKVFP
jgi:hypothetical protein